MFSECSLAALRVFSRCSLGANHFYFLERSLEATWRWIFCFHMYLYDLMVIILILMLLMTIKIKYVSEEKTYNDNFLGVTRGTSDELMMTFHILRLVTRSG